MAKIDEERILLKVSLLIRDDGNISAVNLITANVVSQVESYVATLYDGLDAVIVEAYNATDYYISTTQPPASTTTTAAPTTTTTTSAPTTTTTTTSGV
jgi:hypothetical protein